MPRWSFEHQITTRRGRLANAILRAGNAPRCAQDLQTRDSAVPCTAGQARQKRNDQRSSSELSVRFVLKDWVSPIQRASVPVRSSAVTYQALRRGRPVPGRKRTGRRRTTAKGERRAPSTWECLLLPISQLVRDKERHGVVLTDHVIVEDLADLLRRRDAVARFHRGFVLLPDDVDAELDAFVGNENRRPRDQLANLVLAFAAKRAIQRALGNRLNCHGDINAGCRERMRRGLRRAHRPGCR